MTVRIEISVFKANKYSVRRAAPLTLEVQLDSMRDKFVEGQGARMKEKLMMIAASCCLVLTACTKAPTTPPPDQESTHQAYVALAEAADSVSESLNQLGATEQSAYPAQTVSEPPNPSSYGMEVPTSIDWNGPVEPLVRQIAQATSYQLKVLGKAPSIPIIVTASEKNTPVGDILRDIGYQCGKRASVIVYPSRRIIELRYANE
ncbi:MAG TPA: LuxR family transcriptional regulator [Coxiellaceae bacterium]|nr:LuxR family transcriptional regulator [Coxiellaceae bacterium]